MKNKVVSIHQPNFFPWLGYFDKMMRSDVFVYLDHVVNNPRTSLYAKRVKIIVNGSEHWLTLSLKSPKDKVCIPINEMEIDKPEIQSGKHLKAIELNYKKSAYFQDVFPLIEQFYCHESPFISIRNVEFSEMICSKMNFNAKRVKSSDMLCSLQSTELLVEICKKCDADCYLVGGGAEGYQDNARFDMNSIDLKYQSFIHPIYPQRNLASFVPGLSIIDSLMNIGFEGVHDLLHNNG